MTERPILFSGPMVRELLAGRKTQTRRPVKVSGMDGGPGWAGKPTGHPGERDLRTCWCDGLGPAVFCPYGEPGDRLWVRETWAPVDHFWNVEVDPPCSIGYAADRTALIFDTDGRGRRLDTYAWNWDIVKWKPGIHLRRRDARLFLEVTGVRVERLQAITEEDARAEAVHGALPADGRANDIAMAEWCRWSRRTDPKAGVASQRGAFAYLWSRMYGDGDFGWGKNPWVWVVTFRRVEAP